MIDTFLQSFQILSDEEIESIQQRGRIISLKKGEFFIQQGQICREAAFILSGCFRSFYYSSAEEEVTYCFTFQNSFLTAYSSFISQMETQENIQAMTDADIFLVSKELTQELETRSVNWLRLMKFIAEQEYINLEKRIFLLQKESAEKRYEDLLAHHPEYLQQIPLNYLASYLGITQRHLSRIRQGSRKSL